MTALDERDVDVPPRLTPITVRLGPDDARRVALLAARTGHSRNEVIRLLLRIGLRFADTIEPKDTRASVAGPIEPRGPPAGPAAPPAGPT